MASQTPFNFTTHDGTDKNGVRAEVFVQVNRGKIKEIKENTGKGVADVHFEVENLKFPIHGWIRTDYDAYKEILTAQNNGTLVEFRIETQRKAGIERETPMADLRTSMAIAKDNTKVILTEVNGISTEEAVTNPNEDPESEYGRHKASDADMTKPAGKAGASATLDSETILANIRTAAASLVVRQPVLDLMAAQALFNGVSVEEVTAAVAGIDKRDASSPTENPRAAFSLEAPSWKEYNSDGRLNLGSTLVAAGIGVESVVYKQLNNKNLLGTENSKEVLDYFTALIFAICDRVQIGAYGNGARPDRAAGSHIRVRGIVYDVIDKSHALPIKAGVNNTITLDGTIKEWLAKVGGESRERFARGIKYSQEYPLFAELVAPESLTGEKVTVKVAEEVAEVKVGDKVFQADGTPSTVTEVTNVPAEVKVAAPVVEAVPEVEVATKETAAQARIKAARAIVDSVPDAPSDETNEYDAAANFDNIAEEAGESDPNMAGVMPQVKLEKGDDRPTATKETIIELQAMLSDSGIDIKDRADLIRVSKLLGYTFGQDFSKAQTIPDDELLGFIDHYVGAGAEGLDNAIRVAVGH